MIWPFGKKQTSREKERGALEYQAVDRLFQEAARAEATEFDLTGTSAYNMTRLPPSVSGLGHVTRFVFSNTGVNSIAPLSALTELETLDLSYSRNLSDISPLAGLKHLKHLHLFRSKVADLAPLQSLGHLNTLGLERVAATDFSALSALSQLEHLNLTDTQITDLSVLEGLSNLKSLSLWNTGITDLSPLAGLTQLETLDLWNTRVSDVMPLVGLPRLTHLNLSHTDVKDLGALADSQTLTYLALWNTPIQTQARGVGRYSGRWYDSDSFRFVRDGDLAAYKKAVARGAMVSEDQWEGPIHAAIHSGQIEIVRFLLSLDPFLANDVAFYDGVYPADTALSLAIDCNQREIVELLLEHGARIALSYDDPDFWDFDMEEMSGLHMSAAARANDVGLLQRFMEAGCPHDARDGRGLTALHWAVAKDRKAAAHHLLNLWRAEQGLASVSPDEMSDEMLSEALRQLGDPRGEFGYARNWEPAGG